MLPKKCSQLKGIIASSLVWLAGGAAAEVSLSELYTRALHHDSVMAAARANLVAGQEYAAIGRAGLLPSVGLSASNNRNEHTREDLPVAEQNRYDYRSTSTSIELRQPLLDVAKWKGYQDGLVRSEHAEVVYLDASQELMLRLAGAYFQLRLSLDTLQLAKAKTRAMAEQKIQAAHLYKAGAAAITDVEESEASLKLAEADELAAINTMLTARKELENVVGPLHAEELEFEELVFTAIDANPKNVNNWLDAAKLHNLKVMAAQLQYQSLGLQASQQKAAHLPTLALVASYSRADHPSYNTNMQRNQAVGVQLSMPLFEGGRTTALSRQSIAAAEKALNDVETARRQAEVLVTQSFYEVVNGVMRIAALGQAVKAREIALQGMKAGQQAGLRSNSDVLNAYQHLFAARRDLQDERYGYLMGRLKLQYAIGGLKAEDLLMP